LSKSIDNIFVDSTIVSSRSASSTINGLSDHDAQYLMIKNIAAADSLEHLKQRIRKIDNETISSFVKNTMILTISLTHLLFAFYTYAV
jgi:hypothetical protein